jgi:hypothetical protein
MRSHATTRTALYDPTGARHGGMPTFPYRLAPTGLLTRRQLRAEGLRPGGQDPAAQIIWRRGARVAFLYRLDRARPVRPMTPGRARALDAAMRARRTCPECRIDRGYCMPTSLGRCWSCESGEQS